eukprot:TRINITY_DN10007_c0_g1_i3.p1 TRINITY_DN10007_c0_g1~~TRINITY_DN10007_c0_g1_i3.p1  ORF type:complete len:332 (+),score=118.76 TRINITY_DN10007_c0_g1_i3:502-1497(+)
MWKKSRFKLVEFHVVPFNFEPGNDLYSTPKTCLITILRTETESRGPLIIMVANAHISYNKRRGDIKLAQTNLILLVLAELKKYFAFLKLNTVTFLCGDFNSAPSSPVFRLITQGSYNCKEMSVGEISGQQYSIIRVGAKHQLISELEKSCNEMLTRAVYMHPKKYPEEVDYKSLTAWYMGIRSPYVTYDFVKRKIKIRSKLMGSKIAEYSERLKTLNHEQRLKLRELFCSSYQEIDDLSDIDNKDNALFTFVLESPLVFKSGYSEVGKAVKEYLHSRFIKDSNIYKAVESEAKAKEIIGDEFNGIDYELSLIHICRCRRIERCRSRWSPYH